MASSKAMAISSLVLRVLTLIVLAASVALLATDKITLSNGTTTTFKDVIAYRYEFATGIICFVYTLLQIPFAMYHIIALLLAIGVGAEFAVTFELKRLLPDFLGSLDGLGAGEINEATSKLDMFLNNANFSAGLLLLALLYTVILSILSSLNRSTTSSSNNKRGFFGSFNDVTVDWASIVIGLVGIVSEQE